MINALLLMLTHHHTTHHHHISKRKIHLKFLISGKNKMKRSKTPNIYAVKVLLNTLLRSVF